MDELKCKSEYYGYNTEFSEEFNFSLCPKCHSKYNRLGKKVDKTQKKPAKTLDTGHTSLAKTSTILPVNTPETPSESSLQNEELDAISSISKPSLLELKFKLVLKFSDGKCYPAKWEYIMTEDFYSFVNGLELLVQSQLESQVIFQDDYIVSYKHEKESGLGTQLASTRDWTEFLKEYDHIVSSKKILMIIITMKKKTNKRIPIR